MGYVIGAIVLIVVAFGIWMYLQGGKGKAAQNTLKDKEAGEADAKKAENELGVTPATDQQQLDWLHQSPDE